MFATNVLLTKCSLSIHHVIHFIVLWLIINPVGTFGETDSNGNSLSEENIKKYKTKLCGDQPITISIAALNDFSKNQQEKVESSFKYLQMLKMILFDIEHDEEDLVEVLRKHHANKQTMLKIVNELEQDYDQHLPIWWYTRECFLVPVINQALQTMDMKILIKMGLFLRDICQQIENVHAKKSNSLDSFTVYRCMKLTIDDFKKLQQSKGDFMSFNSFLFTSIDRELAIEVCSISQQTIEILPVLFEIKIEYPASKLTPFVQLDHLSYDFNSKKDILFSMTSVFRTVNITKIQKNIWQVQLTGTKEKDLSLKLFIEIMRLQTSNKKGWDKLGHMMISMNEPKRAEDLYKVLLDLIDTDDKKEIILLYDNLGTIKFKNGSYEEASFFFEKKLQNQQNSLPSYHSDIASTYTLIGVLNSKMGKFENALLFYQKALEIQENILPSYHPSLAIIYDNMGILYDRMGNHLTALLFHQKALEINEKVLPFYHPDLAITYNNIGLLYQNLENYAEALSFLQKACQINEKILDPDDPNLATIYDNIGVNYQNMEQYENALVFYQKALTINEKVLYPNHPELAYTYNNFGVINSIMGDYSNAISFYQKALQIRQISLPRNHPSIAEIYQNIGDVYYKMKEFSNALSFHEKALQIQEVSLPSHHSDFVRTYLTLGEVYYMMRKYSTAHSYFERGVEVGEVSLPENHSWMKILRQNIARVEKEL